MKKLLTAWLCLAALVCATCVNVSSAQPTGVKRSALTDTAKAKKVASINQPPLTDAAKAKKIATGLIIGTVEARRDARDIGVSGVIENKSLQPLVVSYTFSKFTESGWRVIKSGNNLTIAARRTASVFGTDVATNAMVGYKLDVQSPGQSDSRQFSLAEKKITYVVTADTKGQWVTARYYAPKEAPPNELAGGDARRQQQALRNLGFEAKTTTKRYEHAFAEWDFEFWVYARTASPITRTFDNWRAAVDFRDQVRRLVDDSRMTVDIKER